MGFQSFFSATNVVHCSSRALLILNGSASALRVTGARGVGKFTLHAFLLSRPQLRTPPLRLSAANRHFSAHLPARRSAISAEQVSPRWERLRTSAPVDASSDSPVAPERVALVPTRSALKKFLRAPDLRFGQLRAVPACRLLSTLAGRRVLHILEWRGDQRLDGRPTSFLKIFRGHPPRRR